MITIQKSSIKSIINSLYKKAKILSFIKLDTGLSESYILKVEISNPNVILIIKIFPQKYIQRIENDIKILEFLQNSKVNVPRVLKVNFNYKDTLGFLIEEYIEGKTFYELMIKNLVNDSTIKLIVEQLVNIHNLDKIPSWQNKDHFINTKAEWNNFIVQRVNTNIKDLLKFKIINDAVKKFLENYFDVFVHELKRLNYKLYPLHWDYNPQNIIINKEKNTATVLDFEHTLIGDNHCELGIIKYWLEFYDHSELAIKFTEKYFEYFKKESFSDYLIQNYYFLQVITGLAFLTKKKPGSDAFKRDLEIFRKLLILQNGL